MTSDSDNDSAYEVLSEEPSLIRAHLLAGALEEAGIPTITDEDNAADEFAVSQRMMGLQLVRVFVPKDRIDEARSIFLTLSQPIPLVDEDEEEDLEDEAAPMTPRMAFVTVLVVAGLLAGVALLVNSCRSDGPPSAGQGDGAPRTPAPPEPLMPRPPILHK